MAKYVALLRAVNVGGAGKLSMADLKAMCEHIGFANVRTYIASGNVVFQSSLSAAKVKAYLEESLLDYADKPVGVVIRSAAEMAGVVDGNPFPRAEKNRVIAMFVDEVLDAQAIALVSGMANEKIALGVGQSSGREVYVHYPDGQGQSKLKIMATRTGTGRNINTVAVLARMAGE